MWDLAKRLLDGSLDVSIKDTVSAVRLLAERNHVIAEGAHLAASRHFSIFSFSTG